MREFNRQNPSGFGVPFYLIAGTEYALVYINSCLFLLPYGSDSFVSVRSVAAIRRLSYNVVDGTTVYDDHLEIASNPTVIERVHEWLRR